ncbi:SpoIIE family protein phosphatase [Streptomyces sp. NPDC050161]|uniref:SpoIIE family protein phosphatase n=1 Tax=Streptomyces sp. NPDC050161 TaxID=3365604 RepID=UPI00378C18A2
MQADANAASPLPCDRSVLATLFDGAPHGVALFDTALRYQYVNPAQALINGLPAAEHLGRSIIAVLPEFDERQTVLRAVLRDGRPRDTTFSGLTRHLTGKDRRHWRGSYYRIEADGSCLGLIGVVLEVSSAAHQWEDLERTRRYLTMLDTAATSIGTTLDMDTTCRELADFVVPTLADVASVEVFPPDIGHAVRRPPPGVLRMRRAALAIAPAIRDAVTGNFQEPGEYIDYQEDSVVQRSLATNQPVLANPTDEQLSRSGPAPERAAAYRAMGLHSMIVVPLTARGNPQGILGLGRTGGSPAFTEEEDLVVARELAGRTAVDLEHARRYAHEHGIALELQRALLSEPRGQHPHIEIATRYLPAERDVLVGGDWFDVIPLKDGRHLKAMGDVMGHGVEAAVAMSHYRSLLRLLAEDELPPHRILEQLDTMVERSGLDRAATCLIAVVDRLAGVCEVASAGHLPPVFIDPDRARARIAQLPVGPPLGTGYGTYESQVLPCGPGTVLFMYTDGLVERRDEAIDVSVERLASLRVPASGRLDDLLDEVLNRFGEDAEDDIAVLASRIRTDDRPERQTGGAG